jgi:excisionase family DNA binding protein
VVRTSLTGFNEAGQFLGVSRSMLYELLHSEEIERISIGRRVMISSVAIATFVGTHARRGY